VVSAVFEKILNLVKTNLLLSFIGAFILGGVVVFIVSEKRISEECVLDLNSDKTEVVEEDTEIFVDLSGAVEKPGLYEVKNGSRVGDLLSLGGGVSKDASARWVSKNLNISKKLSDSSKIYIPFEWEVYTPESYEISETVNENYSESGGSTTDNNNAEDSSDIGVSDSDGNDVSSGDETGKINVNTSSVSDLDTLPGIGSANAEKIITNRPYKDYSEFESKSGLYKSTLEGIKDLITF